MVWLSAPVRLVRDLPVALKLASTVVGALSLLTGVSLFAVDRLGFVASLQGKVTEQSLVEQHVQQGLLTALNLRVVSRELQAQQTVTGIRKALDRAEAETAEAEKLLQWASGQDDRELISDAATKLQATRDAVRHVATLRSQMLTNRSKRLFQVRPVFDSALESLATEIQRGAALSGGVDSVVNGGRNNDAGNQDKPAVEILNRYRLAMSRVQASTMMFMATGATAAANDMRDAANQATEAMKALKGQTLPTGVGTDVRMVDTIGTGLSTASAELVTMSQDADAAVSGEVEVASQEMLAAFGKLSAAAVAGQEAAASTALVAAQDASRNIWFMIVAIATLMVSLGTGVTWMIAGPIRRLARTVHDIAEGKTDDAVPFTTWREEVGKMAAAVELLRNVMRQTFIQAQIIEQLPVGVMTAEATGDFRITYMNPAIRQILETVPTAIKVPVDRIVGSGMATFYADGGVHRDIVADPSRLPHRARINLGSETIDLRIHAMFDRNGTYAGPLLVWRHATAQAQLVRRFEESVGAIAGTVAESADTMRGAASAMRQSAIQAGQRTVAVASAAQQASDSVTAAASAAEQVAASVGEVGRHVTESAHIAELAVAEAGATNSSVGRLSDAAERIGAVVRLISEIASRTNLLALNATIEAARAGEAGKGFAVVASEVKSLASQTAKATNEIAQQIAAMQGATVQAVEALRSIGSTIQRMNEITTVIARSVEEQGAAAHSIAQSVVQAAAGAEDVTGNIKLVSEAVDDTAGKAGGVLTAAVGLTEQAAVLRAEVSKFLIAVQHAA